jgi:hypothetical protein
MHIYSFNSKTAGYVKMDYTTLIKDSFVPAHDFL